MPSAWLAAKVEAETTVGADHQRHEPAREHGIGGPAITGCPCDQRAAWTCIGVPVRISSSSPMFWSPVIASRSGRWALIV
jgi:hypothetical protein